MNNTVCMLIAFFITGICIGILFDIFRISRKSFKTPDFFIYIEDIAFWIMTGILILFTIFTFTNGEIRLYMFIILLFGILIYYISISKYFVMISTKIIAFFKHFISLFISPLKKFKKFFKK